MLGNKIWDEVIKRQNNVLAELKNSNEKELVDAADYIISYRKNLEEKEEDISKIAFFSIKEAKKRGVLACDSSFEEIGEGYFEVERKLNDVFMTVCSDFNVQDSDYIESLKVLSKEYIPE